MKRNFIIVFWKALEINCKNKSNKKQEFLFKKTNNDFDLILTRLFKVKCTFPEWRPFPHVAINHQPLTALEQWKASRHPVAVVNRNVGKRDAP